jgi:hypothetical protein
VGLERRANSAAVVALCREIYGERSGKFGIRTIKRQLGDKRAVGERGWSRFRSAKLLVTHSRGAGELQKAP